MRSVVGAVQPQFVHPVLEHSSVLSGPEMERILQPAGKQEFLLFQLSLLDPRLHGISGGRCDLELHGPMDFVLGSGHA